MSTTLENISNVKTTAVFSKDKRHRYLLKIQWDENKPKCTIIMTYPSNADEYLIDQTTMLVRNNAINNGFGEISIVNLFSSLDNKTPKTDKTNACYIHTACEEAQTILLAYGRSDNFGDEKKILLELINKFQDKICFISNKEFGHPLSPANRIWSVQKMKAT